MSTEKLEIGICDDSIEDLKKYDESESSFNSLLSRKLESLFDKEIKKINDESPAIFVFKEFHRQKIWRRHNK